MIDLFVNEIMLGDAYELIKKIPDKSVDCVYTDVPYDMTFTGGGAMKHKLGKYIREEVKDFADGFDLSILDEFIRVLKNINVFIWCSKKQILPIMKHFEPYGVDVNILTWTKSNPIPFGNAIWLSDIEYCLHFYKNAGFNQGWENKAKNYNAPINIVDKNNYKHPTIKPIEMVKKHLLNLTKEGDIVLDPFLGSGTTAAACKEIKRNYIGFEINKDFYKTATDRLNGINQKGELDLFYFGDNTEEKEEEE